MCILLDICSFAFRLLSSVTALSDVDILHFLKGFKMFRMYFVETRHAVTDFIELRRPQLNWSFATFVHFAFLIIDIISRIVYFSHAVYILSPIPSIWVTTYTPLYIMLVASLGRCQCGRKPPYQYYWHSLPRRCPLFLLYIAH